MCSRLSCASAARDEDASHRVLDVFGRYRLLTFDRDPLTGEPTVEVAHEALLRPGSGCASGWSTAGNGLHVQRQLMRAAAEWVSRAGSELPGERGAAGPVSRNWRRRAISRRGWPLTGEERRYLAASLAEQQRNETVEQDRRKS